MYTAAYIYTIYVYIYVKIHKKINVTSIKTIRFPFELTMYFESVLRIAFLTVVYISLMTY